MYKRQVPEQSATVPETPVEEKPPQKPEQLDLFDGKLLSKEAAVHHVIIGQLFDTYWLVQFGEKLYIIDQHAAHEKVLYERLMKDLRNRTFQSQMLSPPIILNPVSYTHLCPSETEQNPRWRMSSLLWQEDRYIFMPIPIWMVKYRR